MRLTLLLTPLVLVLACSGQDSTGPERSASAGEFCSVDRALFFDGGTGKDGIPALSNPLMVAADHPAAAYLAEDDRVLGLIVGGQPLAVPHNILWWHEILNLDRGGVALAITYCPLTGSGTVFDRSVLSGAELGVSGILFKNNLVMYDRTNVESLWPQMMGAAACGPRNRTALPRYPAQEMTWAGWRGLHPRTLVVGGETGFPRDYSLYPYGTYEELDEPPFLPLRNPDTRRPPKERVLGIPVGAAGGIAFPFGELDGVGDLVAENFALDGVGVLVVWDRSRRFAGAFRTRPSFPVENPLDPGVPLTFKVVDSVLVDEETGTEWGLDGSATSGPLIGAWLDPVEDAFVAFWFAWSDFRPDTEVWTGG